MTKNTSELVASAINRVYIQKDVKDSDSAIKMIVANLSVSFSQQNNKFKPTKFIDKCLKDN